jgi:hypothetical protein
MYEIFSEISIEAMYLLADGEARWSGLDWGGTEHLLIGLIEVEGDTETSFLKPLGITADSVRVAAADLARRGFSEKVVRYRRDGGINYTNEMQSVFTETLKALRVRNYVYIEPHHLLLALIREKGAIGRRILDKLGVSCSDLEEQIEGHLAQHTTSASDETRDYDLTRAKRHLAIWESRLEETQKEGKEEQRAEALKMKTHWEEVMQKLNLRNQASRDELEIRIDPGDGEQGDLVIRVLINGEIVPRNAYCLDVESFFSAIGLSKVPVRFIGSCGVPQCCGRQYETYSKNSSWQWRAWQWQQAETVIYNLRWTDVHKAASEIISAISPHAPEEHLSSYHQKLDGLQRLAGII